jgi:hypothetical protein
MHAAMAGQKVDLAPEESAQVGFMRERADDQVKRIFGDAPVTEITEERFWLELGGVKVASGRADRVVMNGTRALIQDYKFGFREPDPAESNAQLKFLSVVVAMAYPHLTEVIAQIVSGPYGVTETRYSLPQLAAAYTGILDTLTKLKAAHAPFRPSIEACRYCPAAMICQATKELVGPVAKIQYSALPTDPERAGKLLDECALLERHIEAIRKYYADQLNADPAYQVTGWSMQPGPSRREVTDWRSARNRLEEFVPASELDQLANYSIPNVEKLLGKTLGLRAKDAGTKLAEILGDLLNTRAGNLILKRAKTLEERPLLA